MKILSPHKISSEIIDIINDAKEYLIIVSPYVDFINWELMINSLQNSIKKGVNVYFFVRNEPNNVKSWEQVSNLGIEPKLVKNLHAKFYMNEKNAIISSLNLISNSNSNNIEIGSKLDTYQEIAELKQFIKDYIQPNTSSDIPSEEDIYISKEKFVVVLENFINNNLNTSAKVYFKDNCLNINALNNKYSLTINQITNTLDIAVIFSNIQANNFNLFGNEYLKSQYFKYKLNKGDGQYYDELFAISSKRLTNSNFNYLKVNEKKIIIEEITYFIECISNYKLDIRHKSSQNNSN